VILAAAPVAAQPALRTAVQLAPERTLTAHGAFVGLGAQDDSNLLWSGPNRAAGARVPADFSTFVAPRLRALRLPVVRKFVDVAWYAPTPAGYTWDSPAMQGFYANLAEHQANGTQIMLTIWSLPPWLAGPAARDRDTELRPAGSFPTPDQEQRWAVVVVDLLRRLDALGFDHIRYLGAPNELAGITPARLVRPFTLLRAELAAAGLADRITLFGPDAFVEELPQARATPGLDPLLGIYDFHYYAAAPLEAGLTAAMDRLVREVAPTGKPLWLTEFGDVTAKNDDWRTLALVALATMNYGLNAALMWNVQDQIYNTGNQPAWGLWNVYDDNYRLKPAYYAWQIMAGHLPPAATVYDHSCARNQCADLRLAALGDATGQRTIIAFNLADQPHDLSVDLGVAAPDLPLYRYSLDPARSPDPARVGILPPYERAVALNGATLHDRLAPGALVVYSTYRPIHPPSQATGRAVSATSAEGSAFGPERAVDNDPLSRWSSAFSDDQALTVDLGRAAPIATIAINWEAAHAKRYTVLVSRDGRNWQTIVDVTAGLSGSVTHRFAPVTARYVRIAGLERATPYGYSIWELSVW
jgi:hypothetical protein